MHTALVHVHPAKREMQRDLAKGETTNVNIKYPLAGRLPSRSRRGAQLASEEIDPAGVTYIAIIQACSKSKILVRGLFPLDFRAWRRRRQEPLPRWAEHERRAFGMD